MKRARIALFVLTLAAALGTAQAGDLQVKVVDKDGQPVPDAVVVLAPAGKGLPKTALPTQFTVNQERMRFMPPVSLVATGAKARFVNNDPWEHHVRASAAGTSQFDAAAAGGFELRLDGKADGKPAQVANASFDKAGAVLLGCHLHSSMRGHVYVTDSPWAALTGTDGNATLPGVPDGAVTIRVWHADQLIDIAPQQMMLTAAPAEARLQLNVVPRRRRI